MGLDEIQNAKFQKPQSLKKTGYILEIYDADNKIDAQLYEPVEDGRHIVTMDLPKDVNINDLQRGVVYEFVFDSLKPLAKKFRNFTKRKRN